MSRIPNDGFPNLNFSQLLGTTNSNQSSSSNPSTPSSQNSIGSSSQFPSGQFPFASQYFPQMTPDCQKFHVIYKGITRKSGKNDGGVLEAVKAEYSACNKGKKFAYEHGWRVLKKHPKWDAADHFDSEDHTEIFGPDARPRPPGKTRPAKKTKSETTESSAGSGSGSMKDVLNEELRQKIQAGKSAYEAKKVKERSATELNELQFLTIDADSLPEPKKTIIKNKQAQIMAKYQL
ncbi:hypothetical protein Tco_0588036 [Tanacetum coccineum]